MEDMSELELQLDRREGVLAAEGHGGDRARDKVGRNRVVLLPRERYRE